MDVSKYTIRELEELSREIDKELSSHYKTRMLQQIELNKHYIGKCYKRLYESPWRLVKRIEYIKIVSNFAINEFHLTALLLPSLPEVKFSSSYTRTKSAYNGIIGGWEENFLRLEDIKIQDLSTYIEITPEEFDAQLDLYNSKIKTLDFTHEYKE